ELDEQTLRSSQIPTDGKGLIAFFEKQSPKEGDAKRLEALVRKLDSEIYTIREPAKQELISRGALALPFLRSAFTNANISLEGKKRAELCIEKIEEKRQGVPVSAAARVLAARKEARGAEVLFNFLPTIGGDADTEEEVLACLGRMTITPDKVDPMLLNALKDPLPFRRMVAAYLIGRRAGPQHREQLRALLADADSRVAQRVAQGLFGKRAPQALVESLSGDEKLLRDMKMEFKEDALLEFFRKRTLSAEDQKRLRGLVRNLGSTFHVTRAKATEKILSDGGISALAFLKEAEFDIDVERSRRARELLEKLRGSNNTGVPIAAARLLARPTPKKDASTSEIIRALLAYVPFADDESVEDEILTCLTVMSLREPAIDPELVKALSDASPGRRAAAAYVLGHVGTKEDVAKVLPLLDDPNPIVRLRAAQGSLASRDKRALPAFVRLVQTVPATYMTHVQDTLNRIGDEKGPTEAIIATSADSREKAAKAWTKWLADNGDKVDLSDLVDRESFLGLVTICEYDGQLGNIQGQVSEYSRGAAKRWSFTGVLGAMDAHSLPNGRVLVAENNANRVTERDTKGTVKWEFITPNNPICCQRLPNGNTFIASYNMVMEVRPDRTQVYRITPGPQFYIFSAHKARNGHIVAITAQGMIIEMEAPTGKQINTVQTQTLGNWCSVELLPNGNYLVASMNPGSVREIDRKGTEVWNKQINGVFRATRMPNGNILAASMNTRQVVEIERPSGNIRWTINTTGRPWAVHYR
ncbi:MAG: HEAT repeat domain-containing protein, partial [Planctomycetes bacterium]|nr:HEAT repeat domain-containing protein [Planctomycetota bacterium]